MANEHRRVMELFQRARRLSANQRTEFLDESCDEDASLRAEVDSLLAHHFHPHEIIKTDALGAAIDRAEFDDVFLAHDAESHVLNRIGQFKMQSIIATGGMGTVYRAVQEQPHRVVAVKVMRQCIASAASRRRFEYESEILAKLRHPGIAQVFEAGTHDDQGESVPYFAMEYVPNAQSITEYARQTNLDIQDRLELFARVCDAVEHGHQRGIVHRDLKPDNILVDKDRNPKIIDFGVARSTNADLALTTLKTNVGQIVGTVQYMSPEQCAGDPNDLDTRSDVYSLGMVLFELLARQRPYDVAQLSILEAIHVVREETPARLGALDNRFNGDLETIVRKALQKERERRYRAAGDLGDDLRRYLSGDAILARPTSFVYQLSVFARRNKAVFGAIAAVFTVLLAAIVISSVLYVRAEQSRSAAATRYTEAENARADATAERNRASAAEDAALDVARSMFVSQGNRLADNGDPLRSVAWFAAALEHDRGNAEHESVDKARLTTTMRGCPKLLQVWHHGSRVHSTAIDPSGARVATSHDQGTVRIWNTTSAELITTVQHSDPVNNIAFGPDSSIFVTASDDRTARAWDTATGQPISSPLVHESSVRYAEFSADGSRFVTATEKGTVRVWDASAQPIGEPFTHNIPGAEPPVGVFVTFSPDADRVLTLIPRQHTARIWDVATGRPITSYLVHDDYVSGGRFHLDGDRVVTITSNGTLHTWNAANGRLIDKVVSVQREENVLYESFFSPDGRQLLSTTEGGGTVLSRPGKQFSSLRLDSTTTIFDAAMSENGHQLVTANAAGDVFLWDVADSLETVVSWNHGGIVRDLKFGNPNVVIAATTSQRSARLWDMYGARALTPRLEVGKSRNGRSLKAVISPDGSQFATVGPDEKAQLWDARTGDPLTPPLEHQHEVWYATYSSDSRCLAVSSGISVPGRTAGEVCIWDARTGELLRSLRHEYLVTHVSFSHDGRRLLGSLHAESSAAVVWDLDTGKVLDSIPDCSYVHYASFSPDDRLVVTGGADGTARIWNLAKRKLVISPIRHDHVVHHASFSPDGQYVVTASYDRTVRTWDASSGQPVSPRFVHDVKVRGVWFSPNQRNLYTATDDDRLHRWNLSKDDRATEDLIFHSQLLSGHVFSANGDIEPMEKATLRAGVDRLRAKYPDRFLSTLQDRINWHRRQADICMRDADWFSARWHLNRLIDIDPSEAKWHEVRGRVGMELRNWQEASADFQRAIDLGLTEEQVLIDRRCCTEFATQETIVPMASTWKWLHPTDGIDPATIDDDFHATFFHADFDDTAWQLGRNHPGPTGGFGYGEPVDIDLGTPEHGKRRTAYFRHAFNVDSTFTNLIVSMRRKHGVIVYLDGAEVARDNMEDGEEAYDLSAIEHSMGGKLEHIAIPGSIEPGDHILAISLHIFWEVSNKLRMSDCSLSGRRSDNSSNGLSDR